MREDLTIGDLSACTMDTFNVNAGLSFWRKARDVQPSVHGQRGQSGCSQVGARLFARVLLGGSAILCDVDLDTQIPQAEDLDRQRSKDLPQEAHLGLVSGTQEDP